MKLNKSIKNLTLKKSQINKTEYSFLFDFLEINRFAKIYSL